TAPARTAGGGRFPNRPSLRRASRWGPIPKEGVPMECRTARLLLDLAHPPADPLDAADAGALEGHLACCPDCAALARGQGRFDDAVGLAMRRVAVPEGLRDRLLARLEQEPPTRRRWLT